MTHPEQLPVTLPNKQFPLGDIDKPHYTEMADDWFKTVSDYEYERFENYIDLASIPKSQHGIEGLKTHAAALKLCDSWDYHSCGYVYRRAEAGYLLARAFQDATFFIPVFNADLSEEIEYLNSNDNVEKGRFYGRVSKAEDFGRAAWAGMQHSHPNIHKQFERLFELGRGTYRLDIDNGKDIFIAGMMLPYMFAYVSQLEEYVARNGYTGLYPEPIEE